MSQPELPFNSSSETSGYEQWQAQRRRTMTRLARRLGLPLGHKVELWLRGNIRLRGTLRLREELLFIDPDLADQLQLTVDGVSFSTAEMESCVRTD